MHHRHIMSAAPALTLVIALLGILSPSQALAWPFSHDPGGNVLDYYEQVRAANVAGREVVIDGTCSSACTMKLGAEHACVTPNARLRFHSASAHGSNSKAGNQILKSAYPRPIREWLASNHALRSQEFTEMTGEEAIALGISKCRSNFISQVAMLSWSYIAR